MDASQIKGRLNTAEQWILSNPNPPLKGPKSWAYKAGRTGYAVVRDVAGGQLTLHAMSLVYTTLLSIVPMMALSFSVLKALGVHEKMEPFLYQFFEPMGAQGVQIAQQVLAFVDNIKVGVLGSVGLAVLVYTVISLVQKVENSFNMIWRVPQMRSLSQRFSNYLSVIMVGPLLMVSAIGLSATIFSSDIVQTLIAIEPLGTVILFMSQFTPFLMVVLAFTFVYTFMPNTKVQFKSAFIGGVIAGVSWQAGGILFASFVAGSSKYAAIYSSFAIGIILLIWLYLNWLILLIGSSIAFYLQNQGSVAKRSTVRVSPELLENIGLALMWLVCRPFTEGKPAPQQEELEEELRVPGEVTRRVTDKLIRGGLLSLAGDDGDRLVPAKTLDLISVGEVLRVVRSDEDGLARRLPEVVPTEMLDSSNQRDDRSMAELLRNS